MMKNIKWIMPVCLIIMALNGCEEDQLVPRDKDTAAPGLISNPKVVSMPGAVEITYQLPSDDNLLYVVAEYTNKYGALIQAKASYYTNNLLIEGIADTANYKVNLYAVSKSEVRSEPVTVNIKALTPPIYDIHRNLSVVKDFGGVNVSFSNPTKADIALVICYKDSLSNFITQETFYTKLEQGSFTARGFAPVETIFGVYVRDRWNNRTDTLIKTLTPIFEKTLDKKLFKLVALPTDAPFNWGLPMPGMWDGKIGAENMFHTADIGCPMQFTFDLGVTAKLSRFTLWQRQGTWIYQHGNPKRYEIWGSTNPSSDGSWNGWTKLVSCTSVKPSGQPQGQNTTEDVAAAVRGEEWNVPISAPSVRYIRVKVLEAWVGAGGLAAHISEMTFYGNDN